MQRKTDKKVYNAGKGKTNQELIYLHMSNHYRRVLNAKKTIDTSLPYSYKTKRPATGNPSMTRSKVNRRLESPALTDRSVSTNSNKGSCWGTESIAGSSRYHARCIPEDPSFSVKRNHLDMELIDRIAFDTKNGPGRYCNETWTTAKDGKEKIEPKRSSSAKRRLPNPGSQESAQKRKFPIQKKLKTSGVALKGNRFSPKVLKTEVVSKLRSLRVYHPPRRKPRNESENSGDSRMTGPLEPSACKCTKICICDNHETVLKKISFNPKEQSLTSSRDSAYNGGVSSLPESRSPTPDERKKQCCCCCCDKTQKTEPAKPVESVESPRAPKHSKPSSDECLKKIQEDSLYVNFIQDITVEVLEKNLYTNKALKKVMKKHIKNNLTRLNKNRMLKEVENLRIQLGIPEDKNLLSLEDDEGESDSSKFYQIISDSEFVLPKTVPEGFTRTTMTSSGTEEKPPAAASETDEEVVSVIQVTKSIRKEKNMENSSDDSEQVFDTKKRQGLKNLKPKVLSGYFPSSSDSDTSGKLNEGFGGNLLGKKNRSVSFWKNPELDVNRTVEVKQKKTISRGREVNKQKND